MTEREEQRDLLNELLEAISIGDGCAGCLAGAASIVLLIVVCMALWSSCGTPSEPPYRWDPSILNGIPGMYGPTPPPPPSGFRDRPQ